MRKRLLSFVAVAAMTLTAMAQTWTAPAQPQLTSSDPEVGSAYFLLNVGCGQFVTGANAWATEISLSTDGKPYMELIYGSISADETVTGTKGTENKALGDGFTLKLNGEFKFSGGNGRTDYAVANSYLWRNDANGFIDLNNQAKGFVFKFTKTESGDYYWQVIAEDTNFPNAATEYIAGVRAGSPVKFDAAQGDENTLWRFVKGSDYSEDFAEQTARYNALKALYDQHLAAAENGVDDSQYATVYNNANATIDELNAATTALKADITRAVVLAKIAESSETNPIDITSVTIENPDFEKGQEPWTITPGMGQNLQVQATGYPNDGNGNPAAGYDDFVVKNWIESWIPQPASLKDGVICQTVAGLPQGRYRIECDVIAVQQSGQVEIGDQHGIFLFYNNGSYTIHSESLSTGNGVPEHFSFDFDYAGTATMTIGLMAEGTNCNWMGMDNFRLYAIGVCKDSPSWTALVVKYNTYIDYADEVKAENAKIAELQSALDAAKSLVDAASDDSKEAEYVAAIDQIDAARKAVEESETAYKKLADFVAKLNADQERFSGDLQAMVEEMYEQWSSAYEDGTVSAAEIDEAIAGYAQQVKQKTQELFDAAAASGETLESPLDITALFDHMDFPDTNGSGQEEFAGGYPSDSPVWMNETSTGNFKTNYGTAEVWDARPFNIYRDFTNLPKGSYTIKTHAFYRVEANDSNYPNYTGGGYDPATEYAYLYAGVNHTKLLNVAEIADPSFENLDSPYDCGDGNFLPNNQHSAYMIFGESQYAALNEKCYVAATGNVLEDGGTLRAGIAGTDQLMGNHWTIWYDFEIYYNGVANLDQDIESLIAQLTELEAAGVTDNVNKKAAAIAEGNAALGESFDTQTAAINTLQEAIEAIKKTQSLINQLDETTARFMTMQSELELSATDGSLDKIFAEIATAQGNDTYESNAQIEGWINDMPKAWVKYVTSATEMEDASEENPVDISAVIINSQFDAEGASRGVTPYGWTADTKMGQNQGYQDNNTYTNEESGITLSQFLEAWNSGAAALSDGSVYQTIAAALPQGYYRLSVDGYATNQDTGDAPDGVFLFANGAGANNNTSIGCQDSKPQTFTVDFSADGSGLTTVGIFVQSTPANWFAVDNFKLEYLGTTAPDTIENLNVTAIGNTAIYGIDGRQQSQLRRGVNIVRVNGKASKVLVK